jgi:hypothetical protein
MIYTLYSKILIKKTICKSWSLRLILIILKLYKKFYIDTILILEINFTMFSCDKLYNSFLQTLPEKVLAHQQAIDKNQLNKVPLNVVVELNAFLKLMKVKLSRIRLCGMFIMKKIQICRKNIPYFSNAVSGASVSKIFSLQEIIYQNRCLETLERFQKTCNDLYSRIHHLYTIFQGFEIEDLLMLGPYEESQRPKSDFIWFDKKRNKYFATNMKALLDSVHPSLLTFSLDDKNGIELFFAHSSSGVKKMKVSFEFKLHGFDVIISSGQINRQCGISHVIEVFDKCSGLLVNISGGGQKILFKGSKKMFMFDNDLIKVEGKWYIYTDTLHICNTQDEAHEISITFQRLNDDIWMRKLHIKCPCCNVWISKEVQQIGTRLSEQCNHITCTECGTTSCFRCEKTLDVCIAWEADLRRNMGILFQENMACQNHNRCPQHKLVNGEIVRCPCDDTCAGHRI